MIDWEGRDNARNLLPFVRALERLQSLAFSATVTEAHWKELAIVLAEEGDLNHPWAKECVAAFLLAERYDERGQPNRSVPSAPEFREFARRYASTHPPAGPIPDACPKCVQQDGRWQIITRNGVEVPIPCDCARGVYLAKRKEADRRKAV